MINVRPSAERGHADHGWLDARHSFSFASYRDLAHMGFRTLRVINEDRIAPDAGFSTHAHNDMEILTIPISGSLAHKDSLGNGSTIVPGEVQRMSAGSGVEHSEFNASQTDPLHLLQIWIRPARVGIDPGYEQRAFADDALRGQLRVVASPDGRDGSLTIHTDAVLSMAKLATDDETTLELAAGRHAWVQVISGALLANDIALAAGDGAAVSGLETITLRATEPCHVIAFDLP